MATSFKQHLETFYSKIANILSRAVLTQENVIAYNHLTRMKLKECSMDFVLFSGWRIFSFSANGREEVSIIYPSLCNNQYTNKLQPKVSLDGEKVQFILQKMHTYIYVIHKRENMHLRICLYICLYETNAKSKDTFISIWWKLAKMNRGRHLKKGEQQ